MSRPTVSIIIPNYNHAQFISRALDCALTQSFPPDEVLVVDDASTDNSVEIISGYARAHPSVKLHRNEVNRGIMASVNGALAAARGDYVATLAADDKHLPGFIEKSVRMLEQHSQAGLCCSDPASFACGEDLVIRNPTGWSDRPVFYPPADLARILNGGYIPGHSSLFRRSALLAAPYLAGMRWHCDWFSNLIIGFRHGACYIPEALSALQVGRESYSSGRHDWAQQSEVLRFLLRALRSAEYADVLPCFIQSSALSHFGDDIAWLVMTEREFWDWPCLLLVQHPLWRRALQIEQTIAQRGEFARVSELEIRVLDAVDGANKLLGQGRAAEALARVKELAARYPDASAPYGLLGSVTLALGDAAAARDAFSAAVRLSPKNAVFLSKLGLAYLRCGNAGPAREAFMQALAIDPNLKEAQDSLRTLG